ncbi:hypothetical protein WN55_02695 [Dufourea novaeangliae]|uniref:Uncharacterized protein n=1 Tax=Dufourea novaeangliae TaxID=178035 RepID=A0A154NZ47_DUFNO|nr:hypothetical protein WN55_02695 [Dufourea novaeangliae]
MVGGGDCKVATVEVEAAAADNTATLPVTRPLNPQSSPPNAQDNAEKNNAANKEMELKNVRSTPAKKRKINGVWVEIDLAPSSKTLRASRTRVSTSRENTVEYIFIDSSSSND